jgi:hypothetical protein
LSGPTKTPITWHLSEDDEYVALGGGSMDVIKSSMSTQETAWWTRGLRGYQRNLLGDALRLENACRIR